MVAFISGLHPAEASLYLNILNILAAFMIVKPLYERGEESTPPGYKNVSVLW
jgi:hypothetical protein